MTIHLYAQGFIYILGGADRHHYPKLELAGLSVFFTWVGAAPEHLNLNHSPSPQPQPQPHPHPEPRPHPKPHPHPRPDQVGAVAAAQPSLQMALLWLFVSHAVSGILHVQIVLSHWSMETYKGSPYTSSDTEWYKMHP